MDLVESLLRLSEAGHYQQISELFKFPIQHCPDMLLMDLLQVVGHVNHYKLRCSCQQTLIYCAWNYG